MYESNHLILKPRDHKYEIAPNVVRTYKMVELNPLQTIKKKAFKF